MKHIILISLILLSFKIKAKHQKLNLQKALDQKLVKAKAISLGGYQGYCINLNLSSQSPDSLIIIVEPGRRLNSIDEKDQDILVVKQEMILLGKYESKWNKIKGYCCQANNHSPSQNARYDVNKLADSSLVIVARYLNSGSFDAHVEQQAIWAISDKKPTANVTGSIDSLSVSLRQLVAAIKGEPVPWYTIISKTHVFASGAMENYPQLLRGKLKYSNPADNYVTLFILDKNGNEVCLLKSQWLKACGESNYDLNVPVKGLAKGKYSIGLRTAEKELTKKEFEI